MIQKKKKNQNLRLVGVADKQLKAQMYRMRGPGPLLHLVGSVRFILPDDRQGVGLRVEHPVIKR